MSKARMILHGLVSSDDFQSIVIPHIDPSYFESKSEQVVLKLISQFIEKYNKRPSVATLLINLADEKISASDFENCKSIIDGFSVPWTFEPEWALTEAEAFCQDRALVGATLKAIEYIENDKPTQELDLPKLFSDALSVSFDTRIGHDYFEEVDNQFLFYTSPESKIQFDIDEFNLITKGGLTRKTLNGFMSSRTGGFKTGALCHLASAYVQSGYNVLYITLEMSEQKIRERIDANMLKMSIDDLPTLELGFYRKKIKEIQDRTAGRLVIREYPASVAHAGHIRFLLKELRQKKGFVPDVIICDYLNLFASQRLKSTDAGNSYRWVKAIAEELRGLMQEFNAIGWTATQSGRQGVAKGEAVDIDDISESYGLAATLDLLLAIISDDELDKKQLLLFKQLKNRYAPKDLLIMFELAVNKDRMTLYSGKNKQHTNQGPFIPPSARKIIDSHESDTFKDWTT